MEDKIFDVSLVSCPDYSEENIKSAFEKLICETGGLDFVKPGMKIAIKVNLVSYLSPDRAATTHPAAVCELVKILKDKGAEVIVGDSPGGLYNSAYVNRVYSATGMKEIEKYGGKLNQNFSQAHAVFPEGVSAKDFEYTAYLDSCDAIINFCKLKTHGMMGMSAGTKNMFGAIPGTFKPEYHFKFPNHKEFSNMLIDLNEYFKPALTIVDAIVGMEGNGPTAGTPRQIGALLASNSPYKVDLACAAIIGLKCADVPTLLSAHERGLIPESADELDISGKISDFYIPDYKNIPTRNNTLFGDMLGKGLFGKIVSSIAGPALASKPKLKKSICIGCGVCKNVCPAGAIKIIKGKAVIEREKCIRCFCCQEFCPKGAMKVHRPLPARILNRHK